jgi:hypothetical protein
MPPYQVDTDSSYQDDWNRLFNDEKLSPLFRDHDSKIAPSSPSCRLDKRQSDPEYAAAAEGGRERTTSSEDPLGHRPSTTTTTSTTATAAAVVSTRVSRITSIIGPESAYVKSGDSAPGDVGGLTPPSSPPPLPDADEPSAPEPEATPPARPSEMLAPSDDLGKLETRSLLVRVTRFVSKRGWKRKVASAFGTAKNVV